MDIYSYLEMEFAYKYPHLWDMWLDRPAINLFVNKRIYASH